MPSLASTALDRAREELVGRAESLELLRRAATTASNRPMVVVVHGGPGVGKTALALVAHLAATEAGHESYFLPAGQLLPTPPGVTAGLQELGLPGGFASLGHQDTRSVLILDGFESIARTAQWLFTQILTRAGANLTVVLTSRRPLAEILAPFETLIECTSIELGSLDAADSSALLARAGVPHSLHARAFEMTRGHPLALRLLARDPDALAGDLPEVPSGMARTLASRILTDASSAEERLGLAGLVVVRATDEAMLRRIVGDTRVGALYESLRSLPYVQETRHGLVPHDLVREVVFQDLLHRDTERLQQIGSAAATEYIERMQHRTPAAQRPLFIEALYALRGNPVVAATFNIEVLSPAWLDPDHTDDDLHWGAGLVESHEGVRARQSFLRHRGPTYVVRDSGESPLGIHHVIPPGERPHPDDDPVTQRALELAEEFAEESGKPVHVTRWWFTRETYQGFGPSMSVMMSMGPLVSSAVEPARHLGITVTTGVDRWAPLSAISPLELADRITMDGVEYGLWRLDPAGAMPGASPADVARQMHPRWLGMLAGVRPPTAPVSPPERIPIPVDAVRSALAAFHAPHKLEVGELAATVGGPDAAERCRDALLAGVSRMAASPTHAELAEVLEATYLKPAVKQRAVAADLNLPWGTYRHRLKRAIGVLAAELTRSQTPGSAPPPR